jgi:orotidine-5'-phosphate decarboxylase
VIPRPENPLMLALDTSDLRQAERWADALAPHIGILKVGLELFWAHGPEGVRRVAAHAPVFVDCKLHDIPTTVERASANVAALGVRVFNVHALGGVAMMRAAAEGAARGAERADAGRPLVLAVVVLSSQAGEDLASPVSLAWEAKEAGLDGVVVSGEDVREVREVCGDAFCLAVPGIRPEGSNGHDQVRVLTPSGAIDAGADYLIVGRPVTEARDPVAAARAILLSTG